MAIRVRPTRNHDEYAPPSAASATTSAAAGRPRRRSGSSRYSRSSGCIAAFDGDAIVGGAGVFPFELTVPGGQLPCAGVTVVGVLPTHRRQGSCAG